MNLIAYSDSEDSGDDAPSRQTPAVKPAPKPAFQKVVDRSNPGKIKLSLPGVSRPQAEKDDLDAEGPPAKKARTGGSTFGGFNAMLPAPKKPQVDAAPSGKRGVGKGLGVGVNLRTGAEPAFKRESRVESEEYDENGNPIKKEPMEKEDFRAMLNLPPPKSGKKEDKPSPVPTSNESPANPAPPTKPAAPPRFLPLSVARGQKKKKKPVVKSAVVAPVDQSSIANASQTSTAETKSPPKPKVSLFSISQETDIPTKGQSTGDYQPLLYGTKEEEDDAPVPDSAFDPSYTSQPPTTSSTQGYAAAAPNDLTNIASELNLSAAERRQLFGRKGQGLDAAKLVEFNTDTEYAHNEMLRAQGETIQHNALKSISGTGKNSLRSLVNVASTQKEALEEHFAAGKRNKKEAGNKYGW
ncbi:hypothetical protein CC80DRAFT_197278 [Byssothecium circinans]|uniref:Mitotic checkpoint regulator, MAD2B-interacting-domain-containing protein n=1 Tax=Byssothecium circinans TaxID=147558 RepID=A0A6A5UA42_9PLEO|nr:hypothetical protein CC80DRAFT_197278 [Byssothecium circinans]